MRYIKSHTMLTKVHHRTCVSTQTFSSQNMNNKTQKCLYVYIEVSSPRSQKLSYKEHSSGESESNNTDSFVLPQTGCQEELRRFAHGLHNLLYNRMPSLCIPFEFTFASKTFSSPKDNLHTKLKNKSHVAANLR